MEITLSKSKILKIDFFGRLYMCLIIQIYDDNEATKLISEHEELKLSVIQCLKLLFIQSSTDVIVSLYTREYAAKLSQSIFLCLAIAKFEKYSLLKSEGISALMTLSYVHDEADSTDIVLRSQVADIIMLFLPGIVKALQDITQRSDIQNHKVTLMAVRALGRIVTLVMEDTSENEIDTFENFPKLSKHIENDDPLGIKIKRDCNESLKKHLKIAIRDKKFLKAAAEKLSYPLSELINLTKHKHFKVRKELINTIGLFLIKSTKNMSVCFSESVEIIISLSQDDNHDVRELAQIVLNEINEKVVSNYQMRSVMEILEENFYKLLTKLPRIIRRSDDASQLLYLNQVAGYLKLLGKKRLPQILISISHLRRLLLALVYVVEFDCSDVNILEENQLRTIETMTHSLNRSWKRFKFLRDTVTREKLILICKYLGEIGDLSILVNSIFELISDTPQYRKELTFLLNCIATSGKIPAISWYQQVINYYIDSDFWYSALQDYEDMPLGLIQSNIIQTCLLTEGLGMFASSLQRKYRQFLLKTLYIIIERAGSGNELISLVGFQALCKISKSQEYKDLPDLFRENIDYISYNVTVKLRRIEKHPGVLDVVAIIMKYSTFDFLPCLKEIVEDALAQLEIHLNQTNSYSLLRVLHTFIVCLRQLELPVERENNKVKKLLDEKNIEGAEKVIQDLLNYYDAKKDSEDIESEDIEETADEIQRKFKEKQHDNTNDIINSVQESNRIETKEPPVYVKLVEDVLRRCLHFLPSRDISKLLLAMQTLNEGLYILANWTNQLLPIVHELWQPLVDRFKGSNVLIINRAWQLLSTLAKLSEDFIRSRTLKEVLPSISKFLKHSAAESYRKDSRHAYKFTQMFKLQRQILLQFSNIGHNLKLHEQELWNWLDITEPYLSIHQHPELQKYCINMYKNIAKLNSDIVWIKCLSIINSKIKNMSDDATLELSDLEIENNCKSEVVNNVNDIIRYVHEITY